MNFRRHQFTLNMTSVCEWSVDSVNGHVTGNISLPRSPSTLEVRLFSHLHGLSLRWHLEWRTGDVLRSVDQGTLVGGEL